MLRVDYRKKHIYEIIKHVMAQLGMLQYVMEAGIIRTISLSLSFLFV